MIELTKELVAGIKKGDQEAMLGAEEVAVFLSFGIENSGIVEPYLSQLKDNPATEEDGDELQQALVKYLEVNKENSSSSAIWALGKFENTKNVEILRAQLSLQLEKVLQHNRGLFNSLEALKRAGEETISRNSYGTMTVEENIEDARKYLAKFGETHPW